MTEEELPALVPLGAALLYFLALFVVLGRGCV
jgi:hypothetical protein